MAEPNRGYERVVSEILTRGKIKRRLAKELIEELKTIMPLKISPYSPSGKFNSGRLLLYITGMLCNWNVFCASIRLLYWIHPEICRKSGHVSG